MVSAFTFSERGGHAVNEDAFAVQAHPDAADCWLCTLADGQGGQAGGGPAARLACATALSAASSCAPSALAWGAWTAVLRSADQAVAADAAAGFTTLIGLCVTDDQVFGASSGDSAVLLLNGDRQTMQLTAEQIKNPPVGSGGARFVPFAATLVRPWKLLVMSDGVWKYVGWERLVASAMGRQGPALIEALQAQARLPGSGQFQDDFTLVLLEEAPPE